MATSETDDEKKGILKEDHSTNGTVNQVKSPEKNTVTRQKDIFAEYDFLIAAFLHAADSIEKEEKTKAIGENKNSI